MILFNSGCKNMGKPFGSLFYQQPEPPQVAVLGPNASVSEIITTINSQNNQIVSLTSDNASVSIPRMPSLNANIDFYRPGFFHMAARSNVLGKIVDFGQNDELFWFWIRGNDPPGVFYARHNEFALSEAANFLPINPAWIIDALGVTPLNPNLQWEGPYPRNNGDFFEMRLKENSPGGFITRVVIVNRYTGVIAAQRIHDSIGKLIVDCTINEFRRDPLTGFYIAKRIDIAVPNAQFQIAIDLGTPDLNKIPESALAQWKIPGNINEPLINIVDRQLPSGNQNLQNFGYENPIQKTSYENY